MTNELSPRTRSELLWLAAILVAVIVLRVVWLGSDPMPELDPGFISDAGTWWKNPRLHAVWGVWTVDDGNFGILTAPAYTIVMRGVFALIGVGYAQAYAANALSGVLSVILVYALVRREASGPSALLAAAFMGINFMTVAYDRSAYPESFQVMMMLATVAAIVTSHGRPWRAVLGGLAVVVVLLSKPPGLVLAPVATATWGTLWLMDRHAGETRRFHTPDLVAYAVAAALAIAVVGIVYLRPHAQDVWTHFQRQVLDGAILGAKVTTRVTLFATRLGYRFNGFFRYERVLLLVTAAFGAARIARVTRRPVTTIEVVSWVWLVLGIGVMGLQTYQQDRRFLFLIPPLAILSALALAQAIEIGESEWSSPHARRIATGAAAGVLAIVVLFYAVPFGVSRAMAVGSMLGQTWNEGVAGGLLLSVLALAVALVAAWWMPTLRFRGNARIQVALAAIPVVYMLAKAGFEVSTRRPGLQNVSQTLDRISAAWPDSERVALGWPAGTLTLGSRVLPVNHETKGRRGAERFPAQLELYAGSPDGTVKQSPIWAVPGRPLKVDCAQLPIWADVAGQPRLLVHIFVEPDRLAACQTAVRAPNQRLQ
ncbi:MAG: hypothetical protein JWM95_5016 [Gemmatimonadetes bacterium]|nr:hypothetical protein [Gemmatimonadota bacterium]